MVEHLCFTYDRESPPVVEGFTRRFDPGTLSLLKGPSGCGKSTLLYLLAAMLRPQTGAILHGDAKLNAMNGRSRAAWRAMHTGFVFQDGILDPSRSVLDNVIEPAIYSGMPRPVAITRAFELLEQFGVGLRPKARPGQVSGGQAQRVALCRALVKDPTILFADEPTGNLDDDTAAIVWGALYAHADSGAVVLVATHRGSPRDAADVVAPETRISVDRRGCEGSTVLADLLSRIGVHGNGCSAPRACHGSASGRDREQGSGRSRLAG